MKNKRILILSAAAVVIIAACSQSSKSSDDDKAPDKLIDSTCYASSFENDNAQMVLQRFKSGKIGGTLRINYAESPQNTGTLDGKFVGDTLFVDYKFSSGTNKLHSNPLAFLKKDGELIMGVGRMGTSMGRTYFLKNEPIDFEAGKFIFKVEKCK